VDRPQLSIIISTLVYIYKLASFYVKFEEKLRPLNTGNRKGYASIPELNEEYYLPFFEREIRTN